MLLITVSKIYFYQTVYLKLGLVDHQMDNVNSIAELSGKKSSKETCDCICYSKYDGTAVKKIQKRDPITGRCICSCKCDV